MTTESNKQSEEEKYCVRYISFAKPVERLLVRLIVLFTVLLLLAQSILTHEGIRYRISKVDRAEGVPAAESASNP
ncbi:DUF5359 family protein [Paenibacillus alkalitolerans]|uniref:DUF5359 family protein n=1 Tax=Paenibacillus alkalitolerans TaxID=2799335 RepID=UPI0018F32261|nr:DUF5359 family protein [Paenibacillus alkalitolerans]